jgi:hypothetical protein
MATNFPTSLDSYAALVDGTDILEAADQNNIRDAMEAVEAKVGIDGSAVSSSHDYKIAQLESGIINVSGATVFNTTLTAASTFQDLDVSGTVGSNTALCYLEITATSGTAHQFLFRPKGYGGAGFSNHNDTYGTCRTDLASGKFGYILCSTNSSGVLQIATTNNTITYTIKLILWVK